MIPNPLWIALVCAFVAAGPAGAADPADNNAAVQEFKAKADQAVEALKTPQAHLLAAPPAYTEEDHNASAKALSDLGALLEPISAKIPQAAAAVRDAAQSENEFWVLAKAGSGPEQLKPLAVKLSDKLDLVSGSFDLVLGRQPRTPATAGTDAQARARMAEKAAALSKIRSEVGAVSGSDNAIGLINGFYGVRGGGTAGDLNGSVVAGTPGNVGTAKPSPVNAPAQRAGFHAGDVPLTAAETAPKPDAKPLPGELPALAAKESACAAAAATPGLDRATARDCSRVGRDWRLVQTVKNGADWVRAHHDELKAAGKEPDNLLSEVDRAMALPEAKRNPELLHLQRRLEALLNDSNMGKADAELQRQLAGLKGPLSPQDQQKLIAALNALKETDPQYFKARGLWADYVNFNRTNLAAFPNGSSFRGEELGLPPPRDKEVLTKTRLLGGSGMLSGQKGSRRFEGNDGSVAEEQTGADGKTVWVKKLVKPESLTISTYDENGKHLGGVVYEKHKSGLIVMHPEGSDRPSQTGKFVNGKFVPEKIENEDGSSRELAGKAAPGAWIIKDKNGKAIGWTLDAEVLSKGSQKTKDARAEQIAEWAVSQGFNSSGAGMTDKYRAQSIASMLRDIFKEPREGVTKTQIYLDKAEGRIVVNMFSDHGVYQMAGKFEDTMSGWNVGKGLPKQGLSLYVRHADSPEDQKAQFTRVEQFEGDWGRERQTTSVDSNVDKWYWWVVGPKVTTTAHTTRSYRQALEGGGWTWKEDSVHTAVAPPVTVYDGKGIIGATGQAVETLGTGMVDLVAAAGAAGMASAPGMQLWASVDPNAKAMQDDLWARAKSNLYNNAVVREIGGDRYERWKAKQGVDDKIYIQNVRQELTDQGHPVLGAVLGGTVKFADNVAPMLIGGEVIEGVGQMGNMGRLAAAGVSWYWGGQAVYGAGKSTIDFGVAAYRYHQNPNDPLARQSFYDNIENMTVQTLNAPMTIGVVSSAAKAVKGKGVTAETGTARPEGAPPEPSKIDLSFMKGLVPDAVAKFDAKIPDLVRNNLGNKVGDALLLPPGTKAKTEEKPPVTPERTVIPENEGMAANRQAFEQMTQDYNTARRGGEKVDPSALVGQLEQGPTLPPELPKNDPGHAASIEARKQAVAKFAQDYLGVKGDLKIIAPETKALSGAEIFVIQNAAGETLAVYKVFSKPGEVVRELGGVSTVNGMGDNPGLGLRNSDGVVKPLGAWQVEGGKVGYMMEGAPGRDVYGVIKDINKAPPGERPATLQRVEGQLDTVAGALAELHNAGETTKIPETKKTEIVQGTQGNLSDLRKPDLQGKATKGAVKRDWTLPDDVYQILKSRVQEQGAKFKSADLEGTITHGDAHPGNFFITKEGKVTMIDIETIMESLDASDRGINTAASDAARFAESIRLNNKAKGLNLSEGEISALENRFIESYLAKSGAPRGPFMDAVEFYRTKMQITALKYADNPADFALFCDQVRASTRK